VGLITGTYSASTAITNMGITAAAIGAQAAGSYAASGSNSDITALNNTNGVGFGVAPTGSINAAVQTKDGVKFPSTAVTSTDPNVLDAYAEGTFTPTLLLNGGTTGQSYLVQLGWYTKVGNRVFFNLQVYSASLGSGVGAVAIGGLPFTSQATSYAVNSVSVMFGNFNAGFTSPLYAKIDPGTTQVNFWKVSGGTTTALQNTDVGSSSFFMISGQYLI
jgi:hypothetical protein